MGSGLALFSKFPILRVGFKAFSLNGSPGRIADGDWFTTKGVAYAKIQHPKAVLDVFTTHLIADYSDRPFRTDNYLPHRLTQAYEMIEFIESHSKGSGTILMGDFNFPINSLEWNTFLAHHPFLTSIYSKLNPAEIPCTCNCPANGYTKSKYKPLTIDYIMFTKNAMEIKEVSTAFTTDLMTHPKPLWSKNERSDDLPKAFSDHYAVTAVLVLKNPTNKPPLLKERSPGLVSVDQTLGVLKDEAKRIGTERLNYILSSTVCIILLLALIITLICMLVSPPNTKFPFYWLIIILPFLSATIFYHICLYSMYYPREKALLGQFITEIKYMYK